MAPGHWFALALWLPLMLAAAAAEERRPCSPNKCGNHTISHPFWLPDQATGRSCGSPDFEVTCNKGTPHIRGAAISLGFAILNISYEERSLHVVDLGKLYLLQHAPNSCLVPIWNTSAKLSAPFTISPGSLGLVLYSCPEAAGAAALALGGGELVRTGMRCGNESQVLVRAGGWYNGTGGYGRYKGCDYAVTPVLGANAEANASDYVRLIDDGFFLTWELPPPRRKGTSKKIMLIAMTSAAGALLFTCIYVLVWCKNGKRLCLLLCKKTSSNTEKNYEAMIVSYGSLAPKRYMYSEVMKITSSRKDQLGKGGYGVVFKGKLHDGRLVAVKFLHDCKGARGTIGFIAPEVHSRTFGVVSTKSDVYSYGMMLLEMVGGRRNIKSIVAKSSEKYFPDWIYDHFVQDDGLQACEVTREIEEIARKMTMIGLWCVQILPAYRPTITKVLEMFERCTDDMDMPPKQNFSGLLENSAHNMDVQSSSTRPEEISLVH